MSAVGERGSEGARLIIKAVDKEDRRPVWLLARGGANTIAQAIWTVQDTRSQDDLETFIRKIRVYDLAGQDDAEAWMAKSFPDLFITRNVLAYKGMSFRYRAVPGKPAGLRVIHPIGRSLGARAAWFRPLGITPFFAKCC
jgi:hypothetical protein